MLQEQPPRDILYRYQRESGTSWLAVDRETVRDVVEVLIEQGVKFTEGMAIMDLHDAIAERQVQSYRFYVKRWRWSAKAVYTLFVEAGIYRRPSNEKPEKRSKNVGATREQNGSNRGADREQKGAKSARNQRIGEQTGATREQTGAARELPYSINISRSISGGARAHARETHDESTEVERDTAHRTTTGQQSAHRKHHAHSNRRRDARSIDDVLRETERSERLLDGMFGDRGFENQSCDDRGFENRAVDE